MNQAIECVAVAYSRPKMMKRILHTLGQFGIPNIVIFKSFLCEKSYLQSDLYSEDKIVRIYEDGSSQTGVNVQPKVLFFDQFKPFLEDFLLHEFTIDEIVIAEPDAAEFDYSQAPKTLVIGPERGFTEKERVLIREKKLSERSFHPLHLRQETAVPFVLGCLQKGPVSRQ